MQSFDSDFSRLNNPNDVQKLLPRTLRRNAFLLPNLFPLVHRSLPSFAIRDSAPHLWLYKDRDFYLGICSSQPPLPETVCTGKGGLTNRASTSHPKQTMETKPAPDLKHTNTRRSTVARVDVDFFDPNGVRQLRRTLTEMSLRESGSDTSEALLVPPAGAEPFDFEKTLRDIVRRHSEANIKTREIGVMFENLRVQGLGASVSYIETFGSFVNPLRLFYFIKTLRHPRIRDILTGFEGTVRSREMLLVLGRPGSGCTTLLKTLANHRADFHSVDGEVFYDALMPDEIAKRFRGDVQYCPEDDVHFPTLTVGETLRFAATTRAPHTRLGPRKEYIDIMIDILTTIFGLKHTLKTKVGDAKIRGVSGGEKKRVSIAEALATRSCLGAWDNSTRGLDASTALEFVQALRIATDVFHLATIVSIYQAGESLYKHFDKVCVIYEGKMAYYGPADHAREYFMDMGYVPANRQSTADFLVAVTDPAGRTARSGAVNIPRTADEFVTYFKASPIGQLNREDMAVYRQEFVGNTERAADYRASAEAEHASTARTISPYTISIPMQARAVMVRRVQILRGNMGAVILQFASFIFQSIIIGTVFLNSPVATKAYFSRGGVLFFALLFAALTTMAEIPSLFTQRPIVLRHQKAAMYHPFIEALAMTIVDIPITFATTILFAIILYFAVHLQETAAQFFVFYLFLFTMAITMKALFRGIAAALTSEAAAHTVAGIALLCLSVYTGYALPKSSMIRAMSWITYINPLRWGFEAIMANEFRTINGTCSTLIPQGPSYESVSIANQACSTVGALPGQNFVDGSRFIKLSFDYSYSNTWKDFGILIGFTVGFVTLLLLFTEFNLSVEGETSVLLFQRGSKSLNIKASAESNDEEKHSTAESDLPLDSSAVHEKSETPISEQPRVSNVFSWTDLQYSVPIAGEGDRKLLDNVMGYVAPGKLTALMGESGAGKTTLLNVLAERTTSGIILGDRHINGQILPSDFQAQTGYCQQMDTHLPTATVREALLFSAKLRQPASVPLAEKEEYVEKCLKMCGLENFADASVGSLGIEHRKRTTIGVELAAKPKLLLFLDEPTSGLGFSLRDLKNCDTWLICGSDSQSAWGIMSFLRSLADNGQAILCTIHQPSSELFQIFDRLLLLKRGGQTVYFGDLGHNATTLLRYFEDNGSRPCLPEENPAEFMLDVIGAGATATSAQNWHDIWLKSPEAQRLQEEIDDIHAEGRSHPPVEAAFHSDFATSWLYQTTQLILRDAQYHWRRPNYIFAKFLLNIVGGLFIGFTFYQAGDTQLETQNKLFSVFISTILCVPLCNQLQVPYINTRAIYEVRERPSRTYSWTALITSQLLVEIPYNIVGSTLFFFTWYWTVGFSSSRAGYTYLFLGIAYPLYYTTIGLAVAAMSSSAEISALAFSFVFSFVIIFNGVMQPFRVLNWWKWMYYVSPFTYLIEGLVGQAIAHRPITCSAVELLTINPPLGQTCGQYMRNFISFAGGYLTNTDATTACQFCSTATTDEWLAQGFQIFNHHRWRDLGLFLIFVGFNTASVYGLAFIFRIRTGSLIPKGLFSHKKTT
ncbi:pleiotropic drug resistance ABC transporter [Mycena capillaripes]|nr:pleiotropic drug resistance ABC transporter [Mycena capillaripes]